MRWVQRVIEICNLLSAASLAYCSVSYSPGDAQCATRDHTHLTGCLQARELQDSDNAKALGHATGLRILLRSTLFKRLTVCLLDGHLPTDECSSTACCDWMPVFMFGFHISFLLVV
jgi:hypothetical protein